MVQAHRRGRVRRVRAAHTGLVTTIEAEGASKETAYGVYAASDGDATQALYRWLGGQGPRGLVAVELFRAHKASGRAKEYRGRSKGKAYDRKNWSLGRLCDILLAHADELGICWGWKNDPKTPYHCWVLYVDLPTGQVSFHAAYRMGGPIYHGEWDRAERVGEFRICAYIGAIHSGEPPQVVEPSRRDAVPDLVQESMAL